MNDIDALRANALKQMDTARRNFLVSLYGAVLFEGIFTLGIIYFANVRDPLHMLIICCTGLIYMPIVLGLVALGAHMNRCTLRVLARLDEG
ncbi:MAG TPA: hypothetical protein VGQ36_20380 [Thermoanaerobaculia bacterium]|jgi:hypothetical protein|nr:hypothetical protein [Thermoanaerobaculia bacterium]